jgi:hypothetical protein
LLLSIVAPMVVGIITVQSASNGVTMKETVAQKRKGVAGLKEPELALAPKMRGTSVRRSSLLARYPVNGAWPAEMRIDMLAAYLDFRTVRELALFSWRSASAYELPRCGAVSGARLGQS